MIRRAGGVTVAQTSFRHDQFRHSWGPPSLTAMAGRAEHFTSRLSTRTHSFGRPFYLKSRTGSSPALLSESSNLNAPPLDGLKSDPCCPLGQIQRGWEPMRGTPIVLYEREQIEMFLRGNWSLRRIAKHLYRDHTVISREVKRNRDKNGRYKAKVAHAKALKRGSREQRRKLDEDDTLCNWVVQKLRDDAWSPQQIAGRLKNRPDSQVIGSYVSHETIYQWIYEGQGRFMGLYQYLPRSHKKRRKYKGRKARKDKGISFMTPIVYRPHEVDEKQEFGHWESDSVIGSTRTALSVQKERLIQLVRISRVPDMTAISTEDVLRQRIEEIGSEHFLTITFDRGTEGANHYKLRLDYDIDTYHCDPYCSWQKGAVENMNARIRRFLPKGTDFEALTDYDIYVIQERLNDTPLKILEYKTANELSREFIG